MFPVSRNGRCQGVDSEVLPTSPTLVAEGLCALAANLLLSLQRTHWGVPLWIGGKLSHTHIEN